MSFPIAVKAAFESLLLKNLKLTEKFGGPVSVGWIRQTLYVTLPNAVQDLSKPWVDNQEVRIIAKYSKPRHGWLVEAHGIPYSPSVTTETLVGYVAQVFEKARAR